MIDLFERQVVKCRSINQFNRLHIALENRLTPLEVRDLSILIARRYSSTPSAFWIEKLWNSRRLAGKTVPEGYVRQRLKPNLYLYSGYGARREKTLVVGFAGASRKLFLPISDFLQNMDSSTADVLLVSPHSESYYKNGILGLGSSLGEVLSVLKNVIEPLGYRRVVSLGTSSGALPALLAAIHLGFERGICVGGQSILAERFRWILEDETLRSISQNWNGRPELLSIFSAEHPKDRNAAIELQKVLPLLLWPVEGNKQHNAFFNHWASGSLSGFFQKILIAEWSEASTGSPDLVFDPEKRLRHSQAVIDRLRMQDDAALNAKASSIKQAEL